MQHDEQNEHMNSINTEPRTLKVISSKTISELTKKISKNRKIKQQYECLQQGDA